MIQGDPVAAHAASRPDKHAVVTVDANTERATTFAALDVRANRLANLLAAWGVGGGERVAVMLPNGAEWFETNLAVARLQAQLVPVNWHLTHGEIGWILADADARVLISHRTFAGAAGDALDAAPRCAALWVDDGYEEALAGVPPDPPASIGAPAPGLVLYTSGTTGRPKGVVHEQTTTTRTRADHVALWGFTADDVHLLAGPAYHGAPWSFAVTHLALGATVVALTRWDAATFVDAVDRHGATNTFVVPTHFARLLELADTSSVPTAIPDDLSSLRLVLHGAAACPVAVKERILDMLPGVDVCEFYGFSEAGRVTRIDPVEWRAHRGSCGRPIDGVGVLILDDEGREVPVGKTGTIWVVPAGGRFHYRGNDAATAAVTRVTRLGTAVTGGDVGRLDADGYLYVTDRSVDLVVRGGVNVYPREVEDALLEHPAVVDCAVLGIPDDVYGERIVALVEPTAGVDADARGLDVHCRERLASFKCPEQYRFVAALPRDPNGKVRKGQLRESLRSDAGRADGGRADGGGLTSRNRTHSVAHMLEGRVAVVTGAGRGIGRAEATRLAAYGARVVVNDLGVATDGSSTTESPADETAAEITAAGGTAVADRSDISTIEGGAALVERALNEWGQIDIVVNNAGFGRPRMVFNMGPDEWDDVVRVHLRGTFAVSAPACRWWREQHKAGRPVSGRVVNTSTGLLLYGGAGQSNYAAAKAGALAFTESIATEMAPYGVTANCIMPSAATRLANIGWRTSRNAKRHDVDFDPTDPVHVAEMVCYLASPAGHWISGQCFQVRGGIVEHVRTFAVDHVIERADHGWTVADLADELPRMFGAGARRADPPPKDWQAAYRAKGSASTSPAPGT